MLLMGLVPETASVSDIARATGYSAMTATRILNALEDVGIVACVKEGRTRRIVAPDSHYGLWERTETPPRIPGSEDPLSSHCEASRGNSRSRLPRPVAHE